jgi:hypothetical protein
MGESAMLRITIYDKPQETSFLVEGRLVGQWVRALEKCWEIGLAAEPSKAMLVTLSLSALDHEGRDLLTRMRRQGVALDSAGILMQAIIAEIEGKVEATEAACGFNGGSPIRGAHEKHLETQAAN